LEKKVLSFGVRDAVGTAGRWLVVPNAVNSVPRFAQLDIDVRDIDAARRDEVLRAVDGGAQSIAVRRRVRTVNVLAIWLWIATCVHAVGPVKRCHAAAAGDIKLMSSCWQSWRW
jgi:hypothetical protein